jgi:crotonobetainyl-CoA:carnitine CoA-transferase CaiB-like acyl-CoA transferase
MRERAMVVQIAQPGATRPVRSVASPIRLTATPADHHRLPAPGLGEHTEEVLAQAGMSADDVVRLLADGTIAGPSSGSVASFMP